LSDENLFITSSDLYIYYVGSKDGKVQ